MEFSASQVDVKSPWDNGFGLGVCPIFIQIFSASEPAFVSSSGSYIPWSSYERLH
jgi:hypothetical protein